MKTLARVVLVAHPRVLDPDLRIELEHAKAAGARDIGTGVAIGALAEEAETPRGAGDQAEGTLRLADALEAVT